MGKELWIRADRPADKASRKELVVAALESGIDTAIVRPEDADFASLGKITLLFNDGGFLSDGWEAVGRIVELNSPEDQDAVLELAGQTGVVILETSDWTVIPLENVIARFRNSPVKIFAPAASAADAKVYATTLECGTDGIVIDVDDVSLISSFKAMNDSLEHVSFGTLRVTNVRPIEMGDRVCIDTCTLMSPGEGMLVGSQSSCLFLVQSESEDNGYVAARPFRVNASAVHAYLMTPGKKTRYLSELRSGDPVLIVNSRGETRLSAVGRCKVERRPMVLVEATDGAAVHTVILQNAETVKLVGPKGSVSVSLLKPGDEVLARLESGGRHFGTSVEETIREV